MYEGVRARTRRQKNLLLSTEQTKKNTNKNTNTNTGSGQLSFADDRTTPSDSQSDSDSNLQSRSASNSNSDSESEPASNSNDESSPWVAKPSGRIQQPNVYIQKNLMKIKMEVDYNPIVRVKQEIAYEDEDEEEIQPVCREKSIEKMQDPSVNKTKEDKKILPFLPKKSDRSPKRKSQRGNKATESTLEPPPIQRTEPVKEPADLQKNFGQTGSDKPIQPVLEPPNKRGQKVTKKDAIVIEIDDDIEVLEITPPKRRKTCSPDGISMEIQTKRSFFRRKSLSSPSKGECKSNKAQNIVDLTEKVMQVPEQLSSLEPSPSLLDVSDSNQSAETIPLPDPDKEKDDDASSPDETDYFQIISESMSTIYEELHSSTKSKTESVAVLTLNWKQLYAVTDPCVKQGSDNCALVLDNDGANFILMSSQVSWDETLVKYLLGILGNIAKEPILRGRLMTAPIINFVDDVLDLPSLANSFITRHLATYVLVQLASDENSVDNWPSEDPDKISRDVLLSKIRDLILNFWKMSSRDLTSKSAYKSLEHIYTLLEAKHTMECQLWASWTLANLTFDDHYKDMLKKEKDGAGLELLFHFPCKHAKVLKLANLAIGHVDPGKYRKLQRK